MSLGTPEGYANTAAEEVLRLIYGDDFEGCTVSLDAVAAPILAALAAYEPRWPVIEGLEYREGLNAVGGRATRGNPLHFPQ